MKSLIFDASRRQIFFSIYIYQAKNLARSGYLIILLYELAHDGRGCSYEDPNCKRASKHPRVSYGVDDATTDLRLIDVYWARWPEADIGLATGSKSGVTVLDIDGVAGHTSLAALPGAGSGGAELNFRELALDLTT